MPATVEICESNGVGETVTDNISNSNMGNIDAANLNALNYPIAKGERSYAKYQRLHVTNMGGSSRIENIKVWRIGALGGSAAHVSNLKTSAYVQKTYAQPVKTAITNVDQAVPTSAPASANLGIGGSLTGNLVGVGFSDYLVHQIVTNVGDTEGALTDLYFQYDEIA